MVIVSLLIACYLLGSISFALLIGKLFYNVDLREHGSKNLGATNTFRVLGKKAGTVVAIGDVLKGTVATLIPLLFHSNINPLYFGIFAIIGHCYPLFSKFKGGKAVATTSGVILGYNPLLFLGLVLAFLILLILSKMVSFSSILTSLALFVSSFFLGDNVLCFFSLFIWLFITFKHRANIKRIIQKEEPKVHLFKKKSDNL